MGRQGQRDLKSLVVWLCVLSALSGGGLSWLRLNGLDPGTAPTSAVLVVAYSPTLAALIALAATKNRGMLVGLWRSFVRWPTGIRWYCVAFGLPLLIVMGAHGLGVAAGGTEFQYVWPPYSDRGSIGAAIGPLIAGSIGEEIGWRGLAQPILQRYMSVLRASVVIGALWATWHLAPEVITPQSSSALPQIAVETYVRLVATAIIYGWLYNATGYSLPLVMLAHAGHNMALDLMPVPDAFEREIATAMATLYLVAAIFAAASMMRQRLAERKIPSP